MKCHFISIIIFDIKTNSLHIEKTQCFLSLSENEKILIEYMNNSYIFKPLIIFMIILYLTFYREKKKD